MQQLIEEYTQLAIQHGAATESGDYKTGNRVYDEIQDLFQKIVAARMRKELLPLLDHEQPAVRLKAAFHTLATDPKRAEASLESVAKEGPPLVSFTAKMTLKEWRNGNLKAP